MREIPLKPPPMPSMAYVGSVRATRVLARALALLALALGISLLLVP